ncbi:hypothetical protein, partial [Spirosoma endophyticum]|uniref:hypothetical protein n=1 Tax=Spirosoma endophyticum TaxID=662367 RepID=UPI001C42E6D7
IQMAILDFTYTHPGNWRPCPRSVMEVTSSLFYYHQIRNHRWHVVQYVEACRSLQYRVGQAVTLLP